MTELYESKSWLYHQYIVKENSTGTMAKLVKVNSSTIRTWLKNFGIKNEEEVVMPGINGKMNELQAIMGLVLLNYIDEERKKRKILSDTYCECLRNIEGISLPKGNHEGRNSYQYFVLRIDEKLFGRSRNYVYDELKKYNVFTRKYFYPLCSEYTCYRHIPSSNPANLPVANKVANEVLCMPFYGQLSIADVERICDILKHLRG